MDDKLPFAQTKVFTGTVPFSDRPLRAAVLAIAAGERPPRPTHPTLTDGLWALIQRCWDQGAHLRPRALRVVCDLYVSSGITRMPANLFPSQYRHSSVETPC